MITNQEVKPASVFLKGGPVGILLFHGFTGSTSEMSLLADYLNRKEITVSVPLLPGHGTTPKDLNRKNWKDWTASATIALEELRSHCNKVFLAGLSLGSLIALYMAIKEKEIAGVIAFSPPLRLTLPSGLLLTIGRLTKPYPPKGPDDFVDPSAKQHLWNYDVAPLRALGQVLKLAGIVEKGLPSLRVPLLIVYSTRDTALDPGSGQLTYRLAGSKIKEMMVLDGSGHVVTLDRQWTDVADRSYQFIRNCS